MTASQLISCHFITITLAYNNLEEGFIVSMQGNNKGNN